MVSYIRVDVLEEYRIYEAYYNISLLPTYRWRYSNYSEDINYLWTYIHRSLSRNPGDSYGLGIL